MSGLLSLQTLQIALPPAWEIEGQMLAAGVKTLVNQIGGWGQGRQLIRASLSDGWSQVTSVGTQIMMSAQSSVRAGQRRCSHST